MSEPTRVIVLGAGGTCLDIVEILRDLDAASAETRYSCVGFLDDTEQLWGTELQGVPVLGPLEQAAEFPGAYFVNGIGSVATFRAKESIIAKARLPEERFVSLIHPRASVARSARIGAGTVIFPNVVVGSNVTIGAQVIVLPNTVINHDSRIADYTIVTSGVCISGGVAIGRGCYLGTHSSINNGCVIGDKCLIGMGSVVLHDVAPETIVVGNPARPLRRGGVRR